MQDENKSDSTHNDKNLDSKGSVRKKALCNQKAVRLTLIEGTGPIIGIKPNGRTGPTRFKECVNPFHTELQLEGMETATCQAKATVQNPPSISNCQGIDI